jgi:hypothetical protein
MTQNIIPQRPWLNEVIKSGDFEICANCNGTGSNPEYADLNLNLYNAQVSWGKEPNKIFFVYCQKCFGDGYLDWIDNVRGKPPEKYSELTTDPWFVCAEFLILALFYKNSNYDYGRYFDHYVFGWGIQHDKIDLDEGLKNFIKHKSLVAELLTDDQRNMFNCDITIAFMLKGQACTKCFRLLPDKVLYDRLKETYKLIPAIPTDEINYETLYTPDIDFPLFRLCDVCNKNTSFSEILELKRKAFNQNNTRKLSSDYLSELYSATFPNNFI